MKKNLLVLFVIIFFAGISCQEKKELTDTQRKEIAVDIRAQTQEWLNSIKVANQENLNLFLDFFVKNDEASWMGNPALFVGNTYIAPTNEKMEELWRPMIDKRSAHELKIIKDYVAILSMDHAIHVFEAKFRITDNEGNTSKEYSCVMTNVYVQKNDGWKILHHHQSAE